MNDKVRYGFRGIFILSLLYYAFWICYGIKCAINGIDSGWVAPALSDGTVYYGWKGFMEGIGVGVAVTFMAAWYVPLYQIIYLIGLGIIKHKEKKAKRRDT